MTRSLWIVLGCFLLIGVGLVLFAFPADSFERYLALVGLAILGGGAALLAYPVMITVVVAGYFALRLASLAAAFGDWP